MGISAVTGLDRVKVLLVLCNELVAGYLTARLPRLERKRLLYVNLPWQAWHAWHTADSIHHSSTIHSGPPPQDDRRSKRVSIIHTRHKSAE